MQITKGKRARAQKVVVYGPEGIGKSTFAAQFPEPLFIDTEGSTDNMDVSRLDKPSSYTMLKNEIAWVKANPTVCKTLVIDTIDWAESLIVDDICALHQKKGIEDFGYGNGYVYVKEELGRFLNSLSELVDLGINIVLTAHAQIRKFEHPDEMGSYDRWELKLGKKTSSQTAPLVKEWADMVLFANYKTVVMTADNKKKKLLVDNVFCTRNIIQLGMLKTVTVYQRKCRLTMQVLHISLIKRNHSLHLNRNKQRLNLLHKHQHRNKHQLPNQRHRFNHRHKKRHSNRHKRLKA